MKVEIKVYARGKTADQAALRVALHGYGQTTLEESARGLQPGEHVFLVRVSALRLPNSCILANEKSRKR